MPYPLQHNYRSAYADLAPLQAMIRQARAGRDYANPARFAAEPQQKLEQLRRMRAVDPGMRLAELRHRYPTLAARYENRSAADENETPCGICGFSDPAGGPDPTQYVACDGWIPQTNPDTGTRSDTRRSRLERRTTSSPVELR
jgi:hypothetical protein